jgi:Tfp pilus assembly protein PilX
MTVAELLHRISSRELAEWQAYARLEAAEAAQRERERSLKANTAGKVVQVMGGTVTVPTTE